MRDPLYPIRVSNRLHDTHHPPGLGIWGEGYTKGPTGGMVVDALDGRELTRFHPALIFVY
jgi:hypothetical protein